MKIIVSENQFGKIMEYEGLPSDVLIEQVVNVNTANQLTILQQKINAIINDPKKEKAVLDNIDMKLNLTKDNTFVLQIGQQKFPMKKTTTGVYGVLIPQGKALTTNAIPLSTLMGEIEKIPEYKSIVERDPNIKVQLEKKVIYNQIYSDKVNQGYFELRIYGELKDRKEEKLAIDVRRPYPLGEFLQDNKVVFKFPEAYGGYFAELTSNMLMADLTSVDLVPAPKVQKQTQMAPTIKQFMGLGDVFNFGEVSFKDEAKTNQTLQSFIQQLKGYAEQYGTPFIEHIKKQNPTVYGYSSVDGDPNQQIMGEYQPCSGNKTRKDYDLCLSTERAKLIADILNKGLPEFGGVFKYKGVGETTKWGPGWTPKNPTMPAQTAPNRRYLLSKIADYEHKG